MAEPGCPLDLDGDGYLLVRGDRPVPLALTVGTGRTYYQRKALTSALWAYGEDDLLSVVESGIAPDHVMAIGRWHAELTYTPDPAVKSGAGYRFDKAMAMAAVEVLEGVRPLTRKVRRSRSR